MPDRMKAFQISSYSLPAYGIELCETCSVPLLKVLKSKGFISEDRKR